MIIRHKLGYRVYFPGTHEWEKVAMLIATAFDIKAPQVFAYVCADIFTAQAILSEFTDDEDKTLYIKAILKDTYNVDPHPLWLLKALVFYGLKNGHLSGTEIKNIDAPQDYIQIAEEIVNIMNSSIPVLNKLIRLAYYLKPIIEECYKNHQDLSKLAEIFPINDFEHDNMSSILSQLPSDLLNKAMSSLYGKGDGDTIEFAPDPILIQAVKLSLYNEILTTKKKAGKTDSGRYYGTWTIGDDPSNLLVRDTLRTFGIVAPPLYSLKWVNGEKGPSSSCSTIGLALDISDSMLSPATKAARAKEAAYALVEEAKKYASELSICYFNGSTLLKRYNNHYDDAQRDIASVIIKGRTNLLGAIHEIYQESPDLIIIITDAEIYDSVVRQSILNLLKKASETSSTNIFLISEERQLWIENKSWKTFWIKPGEKFVEKISALL